MNVVLYSTHCPKCNVLEKKLKQKNIEFEEVNEIKKIKAKGYFSVPVLEVNGESMQFEVANNWINEQ